MRVIAGKYRGRNLKSPPSLEVRPTSDRLRETLFNVLAPRIEDARFLDLCAGSGAVGIEALSRRAAHATFVDRSRKMCGLVEANLDLCRIPEDETTVVQAEASDFVGRHNGTGVPPVAPGQDAGAGEAWDIVFFDPPYATDYLKTLDRLGSSDKLSPEGVVVVEHHHKKDLPDHIGSLRRSRVLKQGDSALSFYELGSKS